MEKLGAEKGWNYGKVVYHHMKLRHVRGSFWAFVRHFIIDNCFSVLFTGNYSLISILLARNDIVFQRRFGFVRKCLSGSFSCFCTLFKSILVQMSIVISNLVQL
jgi:hypothetical protein